MLYMASQQKHTRIEAHPKPMLEMECFGVRILDSVLPLGQNIGNGLNID